MISCLFDPDGKPRYIPQDDPQFEAAKQAHRDLLQMHFMVDQIGHWAHDDRIRPKFRVLCKDSVKPSEDRQQSKGRDAQCELYFAAICQKAGLEPVFKEPDIICSHNADQIGIAVKRIKSLERLEDRIRDAADQVCGSGITGVIAADITLATNPDDHSLDVVIPDQELAKALKARTDRFVKDHMDRFVAWAKHKWVSGIILVFNDLCACAGESYALETFTAGIAVSDNAKRRGEFLEFFEVFKTGLATEAEQRWK